LGSSTFASELVLTGVVVAAAIAVVVATRGALAADVASSMQREEQR
jgi:hypothetical protein